MPCSSITTLEQLLAKPEHILFEAVSGSRAYGTHHAESDEDIRGIYALPQTDYLTLSAPADHVSDERNDTAYYSLRRFLELAANANPTILEVLYSPQDCIRKQSPAMVPLLDARANFVTKQAYESHLGYAHAQIKKARGRNKWINNPQPETPPAKEAFCWIIPRIGGTMPYRPVPLSKTGIDLTTCHIASLEHVPNTYRLYQYGDGAKGVFRNGTLTCEAIPIDDEEPRCIGLLVYGKKAYESALRNHKHYWGWREERNEARWRSQESGTLNYDAKNMMHTFRLILSGAHILEEGCPLIRFSGENLAFLKAILSGTFSYEELLQQAEERIAVLQTRFRQSKLPDKADHALADRLLYEITQEWEQAHGY